MTGGRRTRTPALAGPLRQCLGDVLAENATLRRTINQLLRSAIVRAGVMQSQQPAAAEKAQAPAAGWTAALLRRRET